MQSHTAVNIGIQALALDGGGKTEQKMVSLKRRGARGRIGFSGQNSPGATTGAAIFA